MCVTLAQSIVRTHWRDCLSAGLGVPQNTPRRARVSIWGEGSLGIIAETAAYVTRINGR